jgi:hypothetical protein
MAGRSVPNSSREPSKRDGSDEQQGRHGGILGELEEPVDFLSAVHGGRELPVDVSGVHAASFSASSLEHLRMSSMAFSFVSKNRTGDTGTSGHDRW